MTSRDPERCSTIGYPSDSLASSLYFTRYRRICAVGRWRCAAGRSIVRATEQH